MRRRSLPLLTVLTVAAALLVLPTFPAHAAGAADFSAGTPGSAAAAGAIESVALAERAAADRASRQGWVTGRAASAGTVMGTARMAGTTSTDAAGTNGPGDVPDLGMPGTEVPDPAFPGGELPGEADTTGGGQSAPGSGNTGGSSDSTGEGNTGGSGNTVPTDASSPTATPAPATTRPPAAAPTAPAPAAPTPTSGAPVVAGAAVRMTFNASPEPVTRGAPVTLSGRVWLTARGNQARVDFFFRARGAVAYSYQGFAQTTDGGGFSRRFVARTSGTWKAVFAGSAGRRNAARLDAVRVLQRRSKEIVAWSRTAVAWQSPALRIPTRNYRALVSWTCGDNGFPYVYLTWTGQRGGYEYVSAEQPSGVLVLKGQAGARRGFFKVTSSQGCTWKVRVFSGITVTEV